MKAEILQRSLISRYEGEYPSFSAFLLTPAPSLADRESTDARGVGEVSFGKGEDLSFSYRETESGIAVAVKKEGKTLHITRGGGVLRFVYGERTEFIYRTSYGALPTEAYCEEISLQKKGHLLLLTLVYTAVFGGMAQKNEMRFKVTY